MAEVIGASLYKLVNAMAGNEVTDTEAKEATAGKTFGEVADELSAGTAGDIGEKVKAAYPIFSRANPMITITVEDFQAILSGTAKIYELTEDEFIPYEEDISLIDKLPASITYEVSVPLGRLQGVLDYSGFADFVAYSKIILRSGNFYFILAQVNYNTVTKKWVFTVEAKVM